MKIYTKKGDKGETSLIGGTRVLKDHIRIEAYGTTDELNSYIGLIKDQDISEDIKLLLKEIQDRLFTIGSNLASDPEKDRMELPDLKIQDITLLEKAIDDMNEQLPELKSFVLPGGHTTISYCHIARCICRRAERIAVTLSKDHMPEFVIQYLNRLSDYLFVLARKLAKDLSAEEIIWEPRK